MAEGVDAGSFDFYEGIRIFVPGALALTLAEGANRTFGFFDSSLVESAVAGIVGALILGLVFYFVDAPAKAAVYFPLLPTDTLWAWERKPLSGGVLNTYFVMLDDDVPASIRSRTLYMGSMYRIGFEAVYLFFVSGCILMTSPSWTKWHGDLRHDEVNPWVYVMGAAAVGVWLFAVVRHGRENAKAPRASDVPTINWNGVDMTILAIAAFLLTFYLLAGDHLSAHDILVLPLVTGLTWATRYFRGYPPADGQRKRRPIAAPHALLLAGATYLLCLVSSSLTAKDSPTTTDESLIAWSLSGLIGLLLICARGHERRLRGAYSTQNTWMDLRKDRLLEKYFEPPSDEPSK